MLILLSPAKTLDFSSELPDNLTTSKPFFDKESLKLVDILQKYSVEDFGKLMSLSPKLADFNYQRFKNFPSQEERPAIFAYKGDVYKGFELNKYTEEHLTFTNNSLRIISGLYGILKPLDLIKPYRLEMSINLPNAKGKNLYYFWDNKITKKLEEEDDVIINLASQEYSSAIKAKNMINITFKESHKGSYKIIGIHSKKARGVMANWIMLNLIKDPESLKTFSLNGYKLSPQLSSDNEYVFIR